MVASNTSFKMCIYIVIYNCIIGVNVKILTSFKK